MRLSNLFRTTILIMLSMTVLQFASAASIGTSRLTAPSSTTLYTSNLNVSIPFSVNLTSGTAGETYLLLNNGPALQNASLYIRFNPGSGTPPFNGTMIVTTSETNPAKPGTYSIQIISFGADMLSPSIANVTLVINKTPPNSTTSTAIQHTSTIPATTSISSAVINQQGSNYSINDYVIVAVVIAIVIVLFLTAYKFVRK